MHRVHRTVALPYTPLQVYELVTDIESYPTFLPWCEDVQVQALEEHAVLATMLIGLRIMRFQLVTRNTMDPGRALRMDLVDGPFSQLTGSWRFDERQDGGCRAIFNIEYELRKMPLRGPLELAFGRIAATFVDAFVVQAGQRYG